MREMTYSPGPGAPFVALAGHIPRVLVVEDVDTTRRRICAALRASGCQVSEAVDGVDGWRQVSSAPFDAVLLDLVMPHLDGWRFRQNQLETPALANIPTIIVTARALGEPDKYFLRANAVLQKPFEDDALVSVVRDVCSAASPAVRLPAAATAEGRVGRALFWSRRGEVACGKHAPASGSERWVVERWALIPQGAGRDRVSYQCQHCSGNGPIHHRTLGGAHS